MRGNILAPSRLIFGGAWFHRAREIATIPGPVSLGPLFPALKRWAKTVRPFGAGFPAWCVTLVCVLSIATSAASDASAANSTGADKSASAAKSSSGDVVLRALGEEMERSKAQLKMDKVQAPYYIEYRVTEIDQFDASAVFGAMRNQQREHGRL